MPEHYVDLSHMQIDISSMPRVNLSYTLYGLLQNHEEQLDWENFYRSRFFGFVDAAAPQVTGEAAHLDCGSYRVCVAAAIDVRKHALQFRVQCSCKTFASAALEKCPTLASACVHGNTAAPPGPCFRMHATASGRPSVTNHLVYTSLQPCACQLGVIGMRTMTARLTFLSN